MFIFRKKKNNQKKMHDIIGKCQCQEEGIVFTHDDVDAMPRGYKGKLTFHAICPYCGHKIHIDEEQLSKCFVRRMYKKHFDSK